MLIPKLLWFQFNCKASHGGLVAGLSEQHFPSCMEVVCRLLFVTLRSRLFVSAICVLFARCWWSRCQADAQRLL